MSAVDQKFVVNSALWAAYGDALGFISELADEKGLRYRVGASEVTETVPWRRRIGGRFGVSVELPAGCYSDDTQLRLATSRAIRGDGTFDVEAFAKVEIPVWGSYALGAGRGSKAAAAALGRPNVSWCANFFAEKHSKYVSGGGNGAAMRVQPHVWSSRNLRNPESFLEDVVKNSVCTHGHPRGFLGAVFHAICLASALERGELPGPKVWEEAISNFSLVTEIVHSDYELRTFWLPIWEEQSQSRLENAVSDVSLECKNDIKSIMEYSGNPNRVYAQMVEKLEGFSNRFRGTGTKTAILASALAWLFRDCSAKEALLASANLLGSDTDTIGTMAGALLGATQSSAPDGEICDGEYISWESYRLWEISRGQPTTSFSYPDLLHWKAPKNQIDAVGVADGAFYVSGLAPGRAVGSEYEVRGKNPAIWQWLNLEFGQTVLTKRRPHPFPTPEHSHPANSVERPSKQLKSPARTELPPVEPLVPDLFSAESEGSEKDKLEAVSKLDNLDEMTKMAISSGFDPELIGRQLLSFADSADGIERGIGYASIIVKAKRARRGRKIK